MKNNRKQTISIIILNVIPLVINLISIFFLPDRIPAHFGVNNVNRWGSKFEVMVFPAAMIFSTLVLLGSAYFTKKVNNEESDSRNNTKIYLMTCISLLVILNVLNAFYLVIAFRQITNLKDLPIHIGNLSFILIGMFMVIFGNVSPKLKKNSVIGLRTKWSMASDELWKKSQHFGGIVSIICGSMLFLCGLLIQNEYVVLALGLTTIMTGGVVSTAYSYIQYKKSK